MNYTTGRDIIGLAETGSGKTAAFALPILQGLLDTPTRLFALVLTPTRSYPGSWYQHETHNGLRSVPKHRELAFQISEQFEALGSGIGVKCGTFWFAVAPHPTPLCYHTAVVVGGIDMMTQAIALAKKPHVVIATPGRLVDHLENTKGFNLRTLRYLVMDEADRILNMDFETEVSSGHCV